MKKLLFILLLAAATGCHKSEDVAPGPDRSEAVTVDFALGVRSDAQAVVRSVEGLVPGAAVALAEGTTVRVLAFERAGENADIVNDTFVAEAAYVADASGLLKPCVVDADGKIAAGTGVAMKLPPAEYKYDFYAITPAAAVADHKNISVGHGVDYACSLTSELVEPSVSGTQTVALNTLVRHCTQLAFEIKPSAKAKYTSMSFADNAVLKYISKAPYTAPICSVWNPDDAAAWPLLALTEPEDAAYNFSIAKDKFVADSETALLFKGEDIVLPKRSSVFKLRMTIKFDSYSATPLEAPVPAMAFAADHRYKFVVTLEGAKLLLILEVGPWIVGNGGDEDLELGEWPKGSIEIGSWELETVETELGGSFVPTVVPGEWVANPNWDTEISGFPTMTAPHYPADWANGGTSTDDLGDSFHGDQTVPGWKPNEGDSDSDMGDSFHGDQNTQDWNTSDSDVEFGA